MASSAGKGLHLLLVVRNTATKPGKKSIELDPSLTSGWMENLWDHSGLDISLFDVLFPNNNNNNNNSFLSISTFFLSTLYFLYSLAVLFPSPKCLWISTHTHIRMQPTHIVWQMQYRASYTAQWLDVMLEQICYIYTLPWLQHLLKPSAKQHSIYLWQRGEQ